MPNNSSHLERMDANCSEFTISEKKEKSWEEQSKEQNLMKKDEAETTQINNQKECDDEDMPTLSLATLTALQDFLQEQQQKQAQLEKLKAVAEQQFESITITSDKENLNDEQNNENDDSFITMDLFAENWQYVFYLPYYFFLYVFFIQIILLLAYIPNHVFSFPYL